MKLLASFVTLSLVAALSAWLWFGQGTEDVETAGVQIDSQEVGHTFVTPESGDASADGDPLVPQTYSAAFVGLQAVLDVWNRQPVEGFADAATLDAWVDDARAEVAARAEEEAQRKAAEAARQKAEQEEAARQEKEQEEASQPPRAVSPPPVSPSPTPPSDDCEWDDGEWDCDDDWDDDDDDDDDWDDDDDDDDDDWDDD